MMILRRKNAGTSERGIALIIALLVLLLLSAVGMGMVMMSNTETNVSSNFRDQQTAFFASKAGIEEARDRLRSAATNSLNGTIPTTALPGATNGVVYVINPAPGEVVTPWLPLGANYPDDEICKEVTCTGGVPTGAWYAAPQSASAGYAAAPILPWKWVRVMAKVNKPSASSKLMSVNGSSGSDTTAGYRVCFTGTNEVAVSNITYTSCAAANTAYQPVYELTALAVTSTGSRRMTQYEVSRTSFPPMPGAMIFDGPSPDFGTNPHSAVFGVNGADAAQGPSAGVGCGAAVNEPALGAYGSGSATSLSGQLNRPGSYTSSTPYTATPAVSDVQSALGPLATVDGLTNLVNSVTQAAGPANVFPNANGATPTNLGTPAAPAINVVQGDYTLGGSGTGILLVTGTLTMNGSPSFNGLILVIGKGNVVKNGGGNGTLNGSLFVANLYSDTPPTYNNLIPLGSNNPPGIPTAAWNGGGNARIQYDSCWINSVTQSFPYRIVAQRELIY
jgi:Tfp pilus assembly protein PilX